MSNMSKSSVTEKTRKKPSPKGREPQPKGRKRGRVTDLPPCTICGEKASGLHYGVNSCEACKVPLLHYPCLVNPSALTNTQNYVESLVHGKENRLNGKSMVSLSLHNLRVHSHLRFIRRELLFSPRNRENPLLNFLVHAKVENIASVNAP